jgi:N4-bis(aminopropyl)spermidine synthase
VPSQFSPSPRMRSDEHVMNDVRALYAIERVRPPSLREFDQIPMHGFDLLRQARLLMPLLAGKQVVFMGDSDCLGVLIGMLGQRPDLRPAAIHILDFDERLLSAAEDVAVRYGFADVLHTWRYNVFDAVPKALADSCDVFVTNPPYGRYNDGKSARLFIRRAVEMIVPDHGRGAIILPDDPSRPWTGEAVKTSLRFLHRHGWEKQAQLHAIHGYHLDDDPGLKSDLILVERTKTDYYRKRPVKSRRQGWDAIPDFYGRSTRPPFPRYILSDGTLDLNWDKSEEHMYEWRRQPSKVAA